MRPGSFGKLVQYFRLSYFTILPIPVAYCPCIFLYTLSCHLTPFSPVVLGNTNFESIPHPLVTFIMSQCGDLTVLSVSHKIIPLGNISNLIIKGGLFWYGSERPRSEWI